MTNFQYPLAVIGSQWGDEGKGKIVDLLSREAEHLVRFNGGNNAGHTVVFNKEQFKLSLLPSGVWHGKKLYLAQGVVINPKILLAEIHFFEKRGLKIQLMIDPRVQIIMPYHQALDAATEAWKGKSATGSLHLGVGYCYEDRNNRSGIRMQELMSSRLLQEKINTWLPLKIKQVEKVFEQPCSLNAELIFQKYWQYGKELSKYVGDVSAELQRLINRKRVPKIIFEGAHGTFLDGVFGTYPYTTAVNTISGAIYAYVGLAPTKSLYTLGVAKSYTTRVGNGPFLTELIDKNGEILQSVGQEVGTVSKRKRRCGWLDLVMLRTASRWSGFSYLALTKLDVLTRLPKIKVCTHYLLRGEKLKEVPADNSDYEKCRPVFREFLGWQKEIGHIRRFLDLPRSAKEYLAFIEKELQVPIKIISVGPDRKQTINR